MRTITVREFADWRKLTEPVRIENRGKPAGTFYPPGTEPDPPITSADIDTVMGPGVLGVPLPAPSVARAIGDKPMSVHEVLSKVNRGKTK